MKVVKVIDKIDVVIANNLVAIKLGVLTDQYPHLLLGKYLHLFSHCKLRILFDQLNISNTSYI